MIEDDDGDDDEDDDEGVIYLSLHMPCRALKVIVQCKKPLILEKR
jgi:hypothetical protein